MAFNSFLRHDIKKKNCTIKSLKKLMLIDNNFLIFFFLFKLIPLIWEICLVLKIIFIKDCIYYVLTYLTIVSKLFFFISDLLKSGQDLGFTDITDNQVSAGSSYLRQFTSSTNQMLPIYLTTQFSENVHFSDKVHYIKIPL